MSNKNEKNAGKAFTDSQAANDMAINERIKKEKGKDKLDPEDANNANNRDRQTDTAHKNRRWKTKKSRHVIKITSTPAARHWDMVGRCR